MCRGTVEKVDFHSPTMLTWTSRRKQVHLFSVLKSSILYNTMVTDTNLRKWNVKLCHWCCDTFEMRTFVEVLFFSQSVLNRWLGLFLGNVSCHIKTYERRVIAGCLIVFAATLVRALQSCCSVWSSSVRTLIFLCECTSWALSDWLVALSVVESLFLHTTQSVRLGGSCSVTVQCVATGVCLDNIKSDFFSPTIDARDDYSSSGIGALSAIPSSLSSFCSVLQIMATFLNFVWSMVYTELRFRRVGWILTSWKSSAKKCAYTEPHHPPI